jgi:phosphoserine aminotransferase
MPHRTPRPATRPADPRFSSGPTKKRPGWTITALEGACLGRSQALTPWLDWAFADTRAAFAS